MITKYDSLIVAEHLLNLIMNDENMEAVTGYVKTFDNTREQGYRIHHYDQTNADKTIAFAQYRNTQETVVYASDSYEGHCGEYSDTFWDSSVRFASGDYNGAKTHIMKILMKTAAPATVING